MAVNDYSERLWRIYKITFKRDGYAYVGMTCQPIPDRIQAHIRTPVNAELTNRLRNELDYDYETLHEMRVSGANGKGLKDVYALEQREIFKLEKPLNIYGINPKAKRLSTFWGHEQTDTRHRKSRKRKRCVHPPREGIYRCSVCREQKPHTEFSKDRSRFNGLHSRCKKCYRVKSGYTPEPERGTLKYCKTPIGRRIREMRLKKGLSIREFVKLLDIEKDYKDPEGIVRLWENKGNPPNRLLPKLADFCEVSEAVLRSERNPKIAEKPRDTEKATLPRTKQRWTNKELERLRELVLLGKSDTEIALLLGRSKTAVLNKRKYTLGIDYRKHWTPEEDARLKQLLTTTDKSLSEIGKLMGRGRGSIERRKEKLGIRRVPFKLDRFNPSHVAQLLKFKMAGWTLAQIANAWGLKNPAQISNVLRGLGFFRYCVCTGKKEYQRWGEVEVHLLRKCLKERMPRRLIYREFPYRSSASISAKIREITMHWLSPAEQAERQQLHDNHLKWRVY